VDSNNQFEATDAPSSSFEMREGGASHTMRRRGLSIPRFELHSPGGTIQPHWSCPDALNCPLPLLSGPLQRLQSWGPSQNLQCRGRASPSSLRVVSTISSRAVCSSSRLLALSHLRQTTRDNPLPLPFNSNYWKFKLLLY
jgi:hypothetical protein